MGGGYNTDKNRFLAVLKINVFLFVIELIIGYSSGSLSMISDGFHAFLHVFASLVALFSEYEFLKFSPEKIKSLSAGINIALFFPLALLIAYKANERLKNPPVVDLGLLFFFVAFLGLVANIYTVIILKLDHYEADSKNKNRFYLLIHMIFDTIGSVIVLIGAVQISMTGDYSIDPIASFILSGLITLAAIWMSRELLYGHSHDH